MFVFQVKFRIFWLEKLSRLLRLQVLVCHFGIRSEWVGTEAWCKCDESIDALSEVILPLGQAVDILSTTLRVANDSHLWLSSDFKNFVDLSWHVRHSHLSPAEVPALLKAPLTIAIINVTMWNASIVAHPDIIALINEPKWQGLIPCASFCPAFSISTIPMLHQQGQFVSMLFRQCRSFA